MRLKDRSICFPATDEVSAAYESAYYLSATGPEMIRIRFLEIGDDIYDHCRISYSADEGGTWDYDQPYQVSWRTPTGVVRKDFGIPVADPRTGRLVVLSTTSVLPTDNALESLHYTFPTYRVSEDGGVTWLFEDRILQRDDAEAYSAEHPLKSVWIGKNALHFSNMPLVSSSGKLIAPVQITRLNPDGTIFCPPGALSFHEAMVLIGSWRDGGRLNWEASEKIILEPDVSTRGLCEGAVAEMPDGRFLMVMRGSNDGDYELPGWKWYCTSHDGGYTWSEVGPWGYSNGELFHSPSAYSTIVKHSKGRYYWFGNISADNPTGNTPRYPVVAGTIDPDGLLLDRDSIMEIDTRRADDTHEVHLSNFSVYEERCTRDVVMRMTRLWVDEEAHMRGDTYLYRIVP